MRRGKLGLEQDSGFKQTGKDKKELRKLGKTGAFFCCSLFTSEKKRLAGRKIHGVEKGQLREKAEMQDSYMGGGGREGGRERWASHKNRRR